MPRGKRRIWRPHDQEWPRAPQGSFLASLEERFLRSETSRAFHVQKFDHSQNSAIRITYRISLRSSSLPEPRYPSAGLLIFDSSKALARRPTTQIRATVLRASFSIGRRAPSLAPLLSPSRKEPKLKAYHASDPRVAVAKKRSLPKSRHLRRGAKESERPPTTRAKHDKGRRPLPPHFLQIEFIL